MGRHHAGILGAGDVRVRNGAVAVTPARSAKCQAESGGFRDDARQSLAIEKRGRLLAFFPLFVLKLSIGLSQHLTQCRIAEVQP